MNIFDNKIDLNIYEQIALRDFLKETINKDNISCHPYYLLLAFVKLERSIDEWKEINSYTD